jgi:hypothetical protein
MQAAFLKLILLCSALALVVPWCQAKRLACGNYEGHQCQTKLQGAVTQPADSLPAMAMPSDSLGVEAHEQMVVVGLSLGSVLSAGSAQQSVNQEGVRDEAAKRGAAKGDDAKQKSRSHQTLNKDAKPAQNVEGKSNIESASGSGNGSTASGSAGGPSRRTPAQESW